MDIEELRKVGTCVFLAAEKEVAEDIARHIMDAADEIERLRAGLTKIKDGVNEPSGWAMDDLQDYCVELLTSA